MVHFKKYNKNFKVFKSFDFETLKEKHFTVVSIGGLSIWESKIIYVQVYYRIYKKINENPVQVFALVVAKKIVVAQLLFLPYCSGIGYKEFGM